MSKYYCEVKNVGECEYVIEFRKEDEVLERKEESCLDDCLFDLYEFERSCYDKYVTSVFDEVHMIMNDVVFGL